MHRRWYRPVPDAIPAGVVVADATAEAAPLWAGPVASVLEELAERLPPESHPEVVFLGDRRGHPLAAVLRGLSPGPAGSEPAVRFTDQLGRYPVAGPLLRDLEGGLPRPVLLVTNSPLIDLEDWAVPGTTGRLLVYRLTGPQRVTPPGFTEVGPETDLGALVDHLRDPVASARVGGPDSLALDWDDPAWRWAGGALECAGPEIPAGAVCFLQPGDEPPPASVRRAGGAEYPVTLAPALPAAELPAVAFTPAEGNVLELWRRGTAFWCQACRRSHPPGQVRCAPPTAGPGLLPSLAADGLYRVASGPGGWSFRPVRRGLAELPGGRVCARLRGATAIYSFAGGRWEPTADDPGAFPPVGVGEFLLSVGPAP